MPECSFKEKLLLRMLDAVDFNKSSGVGWLILGDRLPKDMSAYDLIMLVHLVQSESRSKRWFSILDGPDYWISYERQINPNKAKAMTNKVIESAETLTQCGFLEKHPEKRLYRICWDNVLDLFGPEK